MSKNDGGVTYRAWCEHDDCGWGAKTSDPDPIRVQELSSRKMAAHGIETGHHETFHSEDNHE